jgi:hypothetical protein
MGSGATAAPAASQTDKLTRSIEEDIGPVTTAPPYTATPLLTGTCASPYPAVVSDGAAAITEFAQVGCPFEDGSCCPLPNNADAVLSGCPQDYATTDGGCCPS